MMTASIEHKHKCALVPYLHYLARAAGFEQVSPNVMIKNVIFTGFYGILRHFLVKFPTEFFVFSMDACVYMYIAPLNRRLCCGIFSYLPQFKRGVAPPLSFSFAEVLSNELSRDFHFDREPSLG